MSVTLKTGVWCWKFSFDRKYEN